LAYAPWLLVTGVFGLLTALNVLHDPTALLALLPFAIVCAQLYHPSVLGWALLSVPPVIGSVAVLVTQRYMTTSDYALDVACLLCPALSVLFFPPRLRRNSSWFLWLVGIAVGAIFAVILGAFVVLNRQDIGKKPPRRAVVDLAPRPPAGG
jgi:hypothetical protein